MYVKLSKIWIMFLHVPHKYDRLNCQWFDPSMYVFLTFSLNARIFLHVNELLIVSMIYFVEQMNYILYYINPSYIIV